MADFETKVYDWDDEIQNDETRLITLPEGEYYFKVTKFERGKFPGSAKIPPCNKAILTLETRTDDGVAVTTVDLILASVLEWKIASFFTSIGMKKPNEKIRMDFNGAVGKSGRAYFKPRTWIGNDGNQHEANNVERFLAPAKVSEEEDLPF